MSDFQIEPSLSNAERVSLTTVAGCHTAAEIRCGSNSTQIATVDSTPPADRLRSVRGQSGMKSDFRSMID